MLNKYLFSNWISDKWRFLFHAFLGIISTITPVVFIIWFYIVLISFIKNANRLSRLDLLNFLCYVGPFELLSRMAKTSPFIPYELGKYLTLFVCLLGAFRFRFPFSFPILGLICLFPGIFLSFGVFDTYHQFVFNILGTMNLLLTMALMSNLRITLDELLLSIKNILYGSFSVLCYTIIKAPDFSDARFDNLGASTDFTGGFGSNQVSTLYGLAFFLLFLFWYYNRKFSGFGRIVDILVIGLFLLFGLLSFSRGGMIGGGLGIIMFIVIAVFRSTTGYQNKFLRRRLNIVLIAVPLFIFFLVIANDLSSGNLLLRYKGETVGTVAGYREKDLNLITTGRYEIFTEDLGIFLSNPVFGVGVGQSSILRVDHFGVAAHVEFSRLLAEHGFFGLLIVIYLIFIFFNQFIKSRHSQVRFICWLLFLIGFYTTFHAATRTFVSPLLMSFVFINERTSQVAINLFAKK